MKYSELKRRIERLEAMVENRDAEKLVLKTRAKEAERRLRSMVRDDPTMQSAIVFMSVSTGSLSDDQILCISKAVSFDVLKHAPDPRFILKTVIDEAADEMIEASPFHSRTATRGY